MYILLQVYVYKTRRCISHDVPDIRVFTIIHYQDIFPCAWTKGIIKPIYKKRRNEHEPDNY